MGAHAARRRLDQRAGDTPPGGVVGEDVGLQEDLVTGAADRRDQRRKILRAAGEQGQAVAVDGLQDAVLSGAS
jgi:hypothetical protein